MSNRALTWAFEQEIHSSSVKFVLVAMADVADNRSSASYPSIAYLAECTALDRKTVMKAIDQLEEIGFIVDTGERIGRTGQVKVYRLMLNPVDRFDEDKSPENGTVGTAGTVRKESVLPPLRVPKGSVKTPKNGTRNHEPEPLNLKSAVALAPEGARPLLTSHEVWQQRLDGYDPSDIRGTWKSSWGARPDAIGFGSLVPTELLARWREKRRVTA